MTGDLDTSLRLVVDAIRAALAGRSDGGLVLYDAGSAWLTIELALEELSGDERHASTSATHRWSRGLWRPPRAAPAGVTCMRWRTRRTRLSPPTSSPTASTRRWERPLA